MTAGTRQGRAGPDRGRLPVWRTIACSAVTTAALAALFAPVPAIAAPAPVPAAVPDAGSRPIPQGSLVLPGQTTPTMPIGTGAPGTPAAAASPLFTKIETRRAQVAHLGDRLLTLSEERDIAREQATLATTKQQQARQAVEIAEAATHTAATAALKAAAGLPPGTIGSGLHGLDDLARIQRGEPAGEQAAGRQLILARAAEEATIAESVSSATHLTEISVQYDKLFAEHASQQKDLAKLERKHAAELAAQEAAEAERDRELGEGYGWSDGRDADPRAVAAVNYAKAQIGDWYEWAAEGPKRFDCSGLMWAAYRTQAAGSFQLPRVSRDQYYATRGKVVDRRSLLPGDLLFFSSSNSWTGIHHVAMYAGRGMMVEAPRAGVQVRLVPVRWTRLFQATRIYGSVEATPTTPAPTPKPVKTTKPPATTKPPTTPSKPPKVPPVVTVPKPIPTPSPNPSPKPNPAPAPSKSMSQSASVSQAAPVSAARSTGADSASVANASEVAAPATTATASGPASP